jgi:hypothetical protein
MNAGPNRTVSNVGQQAAQAGPAQGAYGSRESIYPFRGEYLGDYNGSKSKEADDLNGA